MNDTIESFMTRSVHTIGTRSPLAEAHRVMNEHAIRHLPVLEGGQLVGMLSQRDLHLVETLRDVDPKQVTVEEAMSQDAYAVAPETPLSEVARTMAVHKYGSAVIVRGEHVLGIFTTTDALQALDTVLTRQESMGGAPGAGPRKPARKKAAKPARKKAAKKAAKKVSGAAKRTPKPRAQARGAGKRARR